MGKQQQRVLDYMNVFGSISSMEAFQDLGVTRLAAVIFELKRKGIVINSRTEARINRFGEIKHFSRYTIGEQNANQSN